MTSGLGQKKKRRPLQSVPFRESLHDSLTDQLRMMILRHELQPGEWIQEMELCNTLGVSRTPMREALKVLASEKLVILHPYRGASVAAIDIDVVAELFEVQALIESQAGILACKRATEEALAEFSRMNKLLSDYFANNDRAGYFALNQVIHKEIVAMAGNGCLVDSHAAVMKQISHARYAALDEENRWQDSIRQHELIHDALIKREVDKIAGLINDHIEDTSKAIISGLKRSAG